MKYKIRTLSVTTDASGDGTTNDTQSINGDIIAIEWLLGTCDAGVDVTVSCQSTPGGVAQTLLTLTNADANARYYPRVVVHGNTGTALTGTAGGDTIPQAAIGTLRAVVASGGNTKTGTVIVTYADGTY
jgi:hypothetical protein